MSEFYERWGNLLITVLGDGQPLCWEWAHTLPTRGYYCLDIPLDHNAYHSHRLQFSDVQEDPAMPGWLATNFHAEINGNRIGNPKPINIYGADSAYWSSIIHYPLATHFSKDLHHADGTPVSVLSYAFRAKFSTKTPEPAA